MSYFTKHIDEVAEVEFHKIRYRKIEKSKDYFILEKEIKNLVANENKVELLIEAENLRNKSEEEKDISMSINLPLMISLGFGISAYVISVYSINIKSIGLVDFFYYILCICIYMSVVWLIVTRAKSILELQNKKFVFYDTIYRIIKGK